MKLLNIQFFTASGYFLYIRSIYARGFPQRNVLEHPLALLFAYGSSYYLNPI